MGRYIIKLDDYYLEWSTITDSPITFGMKYDDFKAYYKDTYGTDGMHDFDNRMERVTNKGTSSRLDNSVEETISGNRAGQNEDELSKDELIIAYCLMQPIRNGWLVPVIKQD